VKTYPGKPESVRAGKVLDREVPTSRSCERWDNGRMDGHHLMNSGGEDERGTIEETRACTYPHGVILRKKEKKTKAWDKRTWWGGKKHNLISGRARSDKLFPEPDGSEKTGLNAPCGRGRLQGGCGFEKGTEGEEKV